MLDCSGPAAAPACAPDAICRTLKEHRSRDPIDSFKEICLENNLLTQEEIADIYEEVEKTIEEAVDFATESPEPSPESLYTNIYADPEV